MSERFQREIEEVLNNSLGRSESSEKPDSHAGSRPNDSSHGDQHSFGWLRGFLVPSRLFITSGGLLLTALILNVAEAGLSGIIFWFGLLLFVFGYAIYFIRSENMPERRWRGKLVDYGSHPTWRERLRGWLS